MRTFLILILTITAGYCFSQTGGSKALGGPDAGGYSWLDSDETGGPVYNWVEISSTGTQLVLTEDDVSDPISLGFSFNYYGTSYDSIMIYSKGMLSFDGPDYNNYADVLPSTSYAYTIIAPFWGFLDPSAGGSIYYYADTANDRFVVQFDSIQEKDYPGNIYTFQAILNSDRSITYQYKSITGDTEYCSIGIQNSAGTIGLQVVYFSTYLKNNLAVQFTNDENIYGGTIGLSPSTLSYGNVAIGEPSVKTFTISNSSTTKILQGDITTIQGYTVSGAAKNTVNFEIQPVSDKVFNLSFYPAAQQSYNGYVIINSTDPDSPIDSITVSGAGVYPNVSTSTGTLISQVYKGDSKTENFNIINSGLGNLEYSTRLVQIDKASGGPDSYGYTWKDSDETDGPDYYWRDIVNVGTPLNLTDEQVSSKLYIGFNFSYYGNTYDSLRVSNNGFLSFTSNIAGPTNNQIPNTSQPNNILAVFWDDLNYSANGQVYYYYDSVLKRFIVQYENIPKVGETAGNTFQVILYSDGTIIYQYKKMGGMLNYSTVGIENSTGTIGLQAVYNGVYLKNNLAVEFTPPQTGWIKTQPKRGFIAGSSSQQIVVSFNSTGLSVGAHHANLYIDSTDPDTPTVTIPVTLNVLAIPVPTLTSPVNASSTSDLTPTFDWSDVAVAASYTILVDNNSDFASPEINQSPAASTYTPGVNLAAGTYYWKVRTNTAVTTGDYSAPWTVVLQIIPAVPANVTTSLVSGNVYINWDDSANATSYDIYSSTTPYGTFSLLTNVAVSQYTYTSVSGNSKMFFKIVAKNSTKESPLTIEVKGPVSK